eukprot:15358943-Ditylum_brightwellii.AAC.1
MIVHKKFILAALLSAAIDFPVVESVNPVIDCTEETYEVDTIHPLDTGIDYVTPLTLKYSQAGERCTLSRIIPASSSNEKMLVQPVGHSDDGHSWERVAVLDDKLTYDCTSGRDGECKVTLPLLILVAAT